MLVSAVIALRAEQDAMLPPQGRALHAWFLGQVARYDDALAAFLHDGASDLRPFTLSDVRSRLDATPVDGVRLRAGGRYVVRITSIMPELSALLQEALLPRLPERLSLGAVGMRIEGWTTDRSRHAWADVSSRRALWQTSAGQKIHHVKLQFASPTTFRSNDVFAPLPWPRWVLQGLLRKWNLHAQIAMPEGLEPLFEQGVAIRGYRLRATGVRLDKDARRKIPAFWGHCDYAILPKQGDAWPRFVHALASFAFFAGVGKETTRGLGQARVMREKA